MNILFLTHFYPNYVPDLLLHGLRKLIGGRVVDYPRKDSLYDGELLGVPAENEVFFNWFPSDDGIIDREDIPEKVRKGFFKYIICDSRLTWTDWTQLSEKFIIDIKSDVNAIPFFRDEALPVPDGLVIIDGGDAPLKIPSGNYVVCRRETTNAGNTIPLPMALPDEIFEWISAYDNEEKRYSVGFLGSFNEYSEGRRKLIEAIAEFYPDSLLKTTVVPSEDNPNPHGRFNRNDYYRYMQRCRIVLNLPGLGFDTFRYWENAACNAVHIAQRMPIYIPNDFEDNKHILRFSNADELRRAVDAVLEGKVHPDELVEAGREHLLKFHTTTKRAMYLLRRLHAVLG
ncbi:MAG: glycosyltransferase family 1 protein [Nitrospirae bacterium]|nr:MAG: glycosyltransferase family 1 protein [Nitrospirota bacterium]